MSRAVTAFLLLTVPAVISGCGRGKPETYGEIRSPSGSFTVTKQEKGEEDISWDIFLIKHLGGHDHKTPVLTDQRIDGSNAIYGSDGVVMAWDSDHHLTIGWPDVPPVNGPKRVEDVDVSYRSFESDPDKVKASRSETASLDNAVVGFREIDGTFGSAIYQATGKPVPEIQCVIDISATDASGTTVGAQIIGDGIGRSDDPYPSYGGIKVRFIRVRRGENSAVTQAKWGSRLSEKPGRFVLQSNGALKYATFPTSDALAFAEDIQSRSLTLKFVLGFDQYFASYKLNIPGDVSNAFKQFNDCVSKTNVYRNFQLPVKNE
jgi:hypothetical protein